MKAGAADFVMKPWNNGRFLETLGAALAVRRQRRGRGGDGAPAGSDDVPPIVGESAAIQRVRDLIERAAPTDASVLIHGEPGAGKSLTARTVHARSSRAAGPFVTVDGRSLSGEGPAQGGGRGDWRDPGARRDRGALAGRPGRGDGGAGRPGRRAPGVDGDGAGPAALARIRGDLLARLDTVDVFLPSLAERGTDAVLLVEHFVRLFSHRYGREPKPLEPSAIESLRLRPPPGEVRGLRQAAERAVVLSQDPG